MQTLLNDIELDIQELKCLMQAISSDANPTLRMVAKRNIQQMKARLEALQEQLEERQRLLCRQWRKSLLSLLLRSNRSSLIR
mgnify:CR=1 FL=1